MTLRLRQSRAVGVSLWVAFDSFAAAEETSHWQLQLQIRHYYWEYRPCSKTKHDMGEVSLSPGAEVTTRMPNTKKSPLTTIPSYVYVLLGAS